MTLLQMRTELSSRFREFIADTRATRLLNETYHDLLERANWPFLETTVTGVAPLLIADLRAVISVADTTANLTLRSLDVRDIKQMDPAAAITGTPLYYWLDNNTVNVWPTSTTDQLSVRYQQVPVDLANDTDVPVLPSRYQMLIVDGAQLRALAEGPNPRAGNLERLQALQGFYEARVQRLAEALLVREMDQMELLGTAGGSEDDTWWY